MNSSTLGALSRDVAGLLALRLRWVLAGLVCAIAAFVVSSASAEAVDSIAALWLAATVMLTIFLTLSRPLPSSPPSGDVPGGDP